MNPKLELQLIQTFTAKQPKTHYIEVAATPETPYIAQIPVNDDWGWLVPAGIIGGSIIAVLTYSTALMASGFLFNNYLLKPTLK
ncbi:MAG: hypothetical protein QNJ64_13465 [Crocosphaera sp.]|nr:hypothetical protein [Crocosphaera sp.]